MHSSRLCSIVIIPLFAMGLSGCSYAEVLSALQPTQVPTTVAPPTLLSTPSATGTITPTQPTPSFTPTPTLVYLLGTPRLPATPLPFSTPFGTPARIVQPTVAAPNIFTNVSITVKQVFWGSCSPNATIVTAHLDGSVHVESVQLALRLENPKTNDTTPWGGYAIMNEQKDGSFTYRLRAESFSHYHDYLAAWGQFQLIAIGRNEEVVGRSLPFLRLLAVAPCP